jgi:hypothetical protein
MSWLRIGRYVGDGDQELLPGRPPRNDREQLGRIDVRTPDASSAAPRRASRCAR